MVTASGNKVEDGVTIEVSDHHGHGSISDPKVGWPRESAPAITQQNGNVITQKIRHGQVGESIAIEISDCH
jgi:hypothetical protein